MNIIPGLQNMHGDMTEWRHKLHAHPQTAFEETYASELVSTCLESWGVEVHRGLAGTGVVGTIRGSLKDPERAQRTIGLRADIDALDITEQNDLPYRSVYPGKMHACGHDGHTAMLLGAAGYLAKTRQFSGTVHVIFQPAEENEGGGRVMVEQGLFDLFPCDMIFGMHNWPGMEVGQFALCMGPIMAAFDVFEINVRGRGCHAAMPHVGADPVVAAAQIVSALQTIASRNVNPMEQIVVSVTQIHGGDTWNVIPGEVQLRGTVRTFLPTVQTLAEQRMKEIVSGITTAMGCSADVDYQRRYPATVNTPKESSIAASAAAEVAGPENVDLQAIPCMGSEDFAYMLQKCPGCYIWAGNGPCTDGRVLHNGRYNFNDDLLPVGASYWARLAESCL